MAGRADSKLHRRRVPPVMCVRIPHGGRKESVMSYDIRIKRHDGTAVQLRERHNCTGGTYALGGTREAWLNVTYNYSAIFHRLLGEDGIRTIYGMNIKQARPVLESAIAKLGDAKPDADYWKACDGNAKKALQNLVALTDLAITDYPDDEMLWDGD